MDKQPQPDHQAPDAPAIETPGPDGEAPVQEVFAGTESSEPAGEPSGKAQWETVRFADANVEDSGLLPSDARRFKPAHHLAGRKYANHLRQLGVFEEILLFMDCCRDKLRGGHAGHFPYDEAEGDASANDVHHFYAFASGFDKKTREQDVTGSGRLQGIFTHTLLDGLRGSARQDNNVAASDLKKFLLDELEEIYPPDYGRDFLILGERAEAVPVHVTLSEPERGLEILGPDFRPVSPGIAIAATMKLELPAEQSYLFGVPADGGGYLRKEIVTTLQEEVDVAL